jgi:outer membrane lipoprotein-sorting protein
MFKDFDRPVVVTLSRRVGIVTRKRVACFLFFLILSKAGFAQYPGYRAAVHLEQIKVQLSQEAEKITSIKSNFTQEKALSLLAEKINSEGKFWFKRTDKIRLEYTKPFRYLVILNHGSVMTFDGEKENKIPAQANRIVRQVNHLLADAMQGKILSNADFKSTVFENEKHYLIELSPQSRALGDIYKNINIFVDRKDFTVDAVEMLERNGDKTAIKFFQKELNADLSEELFSVH